MLEYISETWQSYATRGHNVTRYNAARQLAANNVSAETRAAAANRAMVARQTEQANKQAHKYIETLITAADNARASARMGYGDLDEMMARIDETVARMLAPETPKAPARKSQGAATGARKNARMPFVKATKEQIEAMTPEQFKVYMRAYNSDKQARARAKKAQAN